MEPLRLISNIEADEFGVTVTFEYPGIQSDEIVYAPYYKVTIHIYNIPRGLDIRHPCGDLTLISDYSQMFIKLQSGRVKRWEKHYGNDLPLVNNINILAYSCLVPQPHIEFFLDANMGNTQVNITEAVLLGIDRNIPFLKIICPISLNETLDFTIPLDHFRILMRHCMGFLNRHIEQIPLMRSKITTIQRALMHAHYRPGGSGALEAEANFKRLQLERGDK